MSEKVECRFRTFEVGATYRPKNPRSRYGARIFLGVSRSQGRGWFDYQPAVAPNGCRYPITVQSWLRWAGERLETPNPNGPHLTEL
jgi:hypothetical protein